MADCNYMAPRPRALSRCKSGTGGTNTTLPLQEHLAGQLPKGAAWGSVLPAGLAQVPGSGVQRLQERGRQERGLGGNARSQPALETGLPSDSGTRPCISLTPVPPLRPQPGNGSAEPLGEVNQPNLCQACLPPVHRPWASPLQK